MSSMEKVLAALGTLDKSKEALTYRLKTTRLKKEETIKTLEASRIPPSSATGVLIKNQHSFNAKLSDALKEEQKQIQYMQAKEQSLYQERMMFSRQCATIKGQLAKQQAIQEKKESERPALSKLNSIFPGNSKK